MSASTSAAAPLAPLAFDDLAPELADVLRPRYDRLGYLGGFFAAMGRQPTALAHFEQFTLSLREALSPALGEVVALTAATRLGNDYERHQHERLAINRGLTRDWVAAVEHGARHTAPEEDVDEGALDDAERAAQAFVLAALETLVPSDHGTAGHGTADQRDSTVALGDLVAATDEATATAIVLLTGRFVAHALVSRACGLTPPVPSIFDVDASTRSDAEEAQR